VVSHDPEFVRTWSSAPRVTTAGCTSSTGQREGVHRPRLAAAAPGARRTGRAGGGEELGGMRGVRHFLQRTAVQGSPDMLTAITGVYTPGAARVETEEHPFRKPMSRLRIGDTVVSEQRLVTEEDIAHFAEFTGDRFYAHTDPEAAAANPLFGGIVAHGYLLLSLAAGLFVDPAPGPGAGQHRAGPAALHSAGEAGAEHPRRPDLRVQDPAHPGAGGGPVGRADPRPGRRARGDVRAADDGPQLVVQA
jgi:oxepin-CoA hydrolase/3-oxo-5,6-dehydrosuberyl-CoA semialdehyde dehydrogenase